jgi:hypothetical protein
VSRVKEDDSKKPYQLCFTLFMTVRRRQILILC